jgi:hypothetical protein
MIDRAKLEEMAAQVANEAANEARRQGATEAEAASEWQCWFAEEMHWLERNAADGQ